MSKRDKAKENARARAARAADPERRREIERRYYERHRLKVLERKKKCLQENLKFRARKHEYDRCYREANREKIRAAARERKRRLYWADPEAARAKRREAYARQQKRLRGE